VEAQLLTKLIMNTLLGSLFGTQPSNQGQWPGQGLANQQGMAQQNLSQQYQSQSYQNAAAQQYTQALIGGLMNQPRAEWMINGQILTFEQFVDTLCPDQDDPMRTLLILKYKGVK
jgi:hypothetical protein